MTAPEVGSRINASYVHFTPTARTAWHTHPHGQTIHISSGVGLVQRRGGPVEVVQTGDRVFFEPGEDHWHGATPDRFMTHLAMLEVIRPGDRVFFEPGENHWHGATPTRFMIHIAMALADESGSPVTWGRHVTDEEYGQAPEVTEVSR